MLAAECNSYVIDIDTVNQVFLCYSEENNTEYTFKIETIEITGKQRLQQGDLLRIENGALVGFCTEVWTKAQINSIKGAPSGFCEFEEMFSD